MHILTFLYYFVTHLIITFPKLICYLPSHFHTRRLHQSDPSIVYYNGSDKSLNLIVMLHGKNGFGCDFIPLINNLRKMHIKNDIITINLKSTGNSSVITDAESLQNLLEAYSRKQLILIGLSKGGLTVLEYITYSKNQHNVAAVITISAPLSGTMTADYLIPQGNIVSRELGLNSKFTQQLKQKIPKNILIYHIEPEYDFAIIPTSSASIVGQNHKTMRYTGFHSHNDITSAIEIAQFIKNWIEPSNPILNKL